VAVAIGIAGRVLSRRDRRLRLRRPIAWLRYLAWHCAPPLLGPALPRLPEHAKGAVFALGVRGRVVMQHAAGPFDGR
jgi:hypothetical protein